MGTLQAPAVSCLWAVRLPWAHSKPRLSAVCGPSGCHGHTPSPGCQLSVGCQAAMGTLQAPVVSCLWAVRLPWAHSKPRFPAEPILVGERSCKPALGAGQWGELAATWNSRQSPVNPALPVTAASQPGPTCNSRQSTRPYL